jgi:hypothetical protein
MLTLDRNGSVYQWVLDFLRDSVIHDVPPHSREALIAEAGYLQVPVTILGPLNSTRGAVRN